MMMSHEKVLDMSLHGFLLWGSMGFLMPLGILAIRCSSCIHQSSNQPKAKLISFYSHALLQVVSLVVSSGGAVLSVKKFENSFNNSHQRIGLVLHIAVWVQAFISIRRPKINSEEIRRRRMWWFIIHWIVGTGTCIMAIFNIYTGLQAFHNRTGRSTRLWTILFTAQLFLMTFSYLFQDKWDYLLLLLLNKNKQQHDDIDGGNVHHLHDHDDDHDDRRISSQILQIKDLVIVNNVDPPSSSSSSLDKINTLAFYFAKTNALKNLFQQQHI
ncbi:cytochrome b561 domain-containing protein At4g18260-like [Impatiens glandulifera]|uniref:cytochrome b561 domain-containing protein At4g18260-like n=1 Tax=Impatiens glandulifera TaxID=253017 RepID=UPI001FB11713|nr:cytochrome b561 domain-containing protein At4g18260-like [Impatiens glandulifera]